MKKMLTIFLVLITMVSLVGVVAWGKRAAKSNQKGINYAHALLAQNALLPQRPQVPVPEHITYGFLFSQTLTIKQKATGQNNPSASGLVIRTAIEKEANLSDAEVRAFDAIAFACAQQVRQQDEKAGKVIAAFRARFPQRTIPTGETLPPPPAELKILQEQRDSFIASARNKLREVLGEQVANRLDEVVKHRISSNAKVP